MKENVSEKESKWLKERERGGEAKLNPIVVIARVHVSGWHGVGGKVMALSMWSDEHLPA